MIFFSASSRLHGDGFIYFFLNRSLQGDQISWLRTRHKIKYIHGALNINGSILVCCFPSGKIISIHAQAFPFSAYRRILNVLSFFLLFPLHDNCLAIGKMATGIFDALSWLVFLKGERLNSDSIACRGPIDESNSCKPAVLGLAERLVFERRLNEEIMGGG